MRLCSLPGCDEELFAKERCRKHYLLLREGATKAKGNAGNTTNHARMTGRQRGISQLPDDLKEAYGFTPPGWQV